MILIKIDNSNTDEKKGGISLKLSGDGKDVFSEYLGLIQQKENIIIEAGKMILEKVEKIKGFKNKC